MKDWYLKTGCRRKHVTLIKIYNHKYFDNRFSSSIFAKQRLIKDNPYKEVEKNGERSLAKTNQ